MAKKILLWITPNLLNFGIANSLKNNSDCELYSIIDIPDNSKSFFKNQKIVNFNESWFFHDQIKKKYNFDLEYLKKFEEKYKINLWLEIINERTFSEFNKFHTFSKKEVLSIVEQECKFFEKIINEIKPEIFITSSWANFHQDSIFSKMCKYHKIKCLFLHSTRITAKKSYISNSSERTPLEIPENFDSSLNNLEQIVKKIKSEKRFTSTKKMRSGEFSIQNKVNSLIKFIFSPSVNHKTHYTYFGRTKLRVLFKIITTEISSYKRKNFLYKNSENMVSENHRKFVFYPLHIEEEAAMLIDAPFYLHQVDLIRKISMSLPVNYQLLVKESPIAFARHWRSISDYKKILQLPNVTLIHPSVDPHDIYPKCSLVVTVTGGAALESLYYKVPSIIFSDSVFSNLSSVTKIEDITKLPSIIKTSLNSGVNSDEILKFYSFIEQNSFDFEIPLLINEIWNKFFSGGILADVKINENEMNDFLNLKKNDFDLLAQEFIKFF